MSPETITLPVTHEDVPQDKPTRKPRSDKGKPKPRPAVPAGMLSKEQVTKLQDLAQVLLFSEHHLIDSQVEHMQAVEAHKQAGENWNAYLSELSGGNK